MRFVRLAVVVALFATGPRIAFAADPTRHVSQYVHRHFGARDGLPHNLANSLVQMADGYLWAGTEQGLSRYDGHTFVNFDRGSGLPTNTISAVAAANGVLWIGTRERGLVVRANGAFTPVSDAAIGLQIRALAIDKAGDVWVGTRDRGVARLHDGHVVATLRAIDGLPSDDVRVIEPARDGSVWIGTFAGAVHVVSGRVTPGPTALAGVLVHAIVEDRHGDIWFGTASGLARMHAGAFSSVEIPTSGDPTVLRLLTDRDNNLWIGRPRGLLRRTDDGHIESLRSLEARVLALVEDRQGDIWIGTELGLDELSEGDMLPMGAAEGLTDEAVYGVFEDSKGTTWIGATGGLFRIPSDGSAPVNVAAEHGTVYAIHEDARGDVWAGTRDGSVGRWHDDRFAWVWTGTWEQVRVIVDAKDGFWIGTDHGLFRSHGDHIDQSEAVIAGPIVTAVAIDRAGTVWVGTEGGGLRHVTDAGVDAPIPPGGPPPRSAVTTLSVDPDGTLWATSEGEGLWRLQGNRWTAITSQNGLFDDLIWRVLDDGHGSLWMSSNRGVWRAPRDKVMAVSRDSTTHFDSVFYGESDGMRDAECNGSFSPAGWRTRAGKLLFPTASGLAMIDPTHLHPVEPQAAIVEAIRIDGQPAAPTAELVIPAGASRLEIQYTAAELRAPDRVRFRYKLEPFDDGWHDAHVERLAQYTNLAPGHYQFVVEAGVDGSWAAGQTLAVTLEPRFVQTRWFVALAVIGAALAILAVPLLRVRQLRARERVLDERVQAALRDVKTLSGLIPICAWCKKIRDDKGYWNLLEAYLTKHTDAKLTHGICPACVSKQEAAEEAADRKR